MAKYDALRDRLTRDGASRVTLTFAEIDALLAGGLPASARQYRVWWRNNDPHIQSSSWADAGYEVENVNLPEGPVVFRRTT